MCNPIRTLLLLCLCSWSPCRAERKLQLPSRRRSHSKNCNRWPYRTTRRSRQSAANIQAAEGRKKQSGLYPNPTVGYQGEQIRGGSFHGGEQGFFVQQDIVLGGKLGLNRKIFDQELKQAETEAEEQKVRVVTNVRMSYIQALAAQQTLELRQNLSKLADDAVETSHQLANVGQADAPDVLESEVEAQQAQLAVTMAEQNQQRVWKALAAVVGNPRLPLMKLEGKLEDTPTGQCG